LNAEAERADRNAAVRSAARAWKKAGAIDEASLKAVEAAYPDDRKRVGPVFRILLFLFTLLTAAGGFGFVWAVINGFADEDKTLGPLFLIFGVGLAFGADLMMTAMKRRQGGIETALSLAAITCLLGFMAWLVFEQVDLPERIAVPVLFAFAALILAPAAWRWGYPLYAAASAAAFLGAIAAMPGGRLLWIALPILAAPFLSRLADSQRFPPAHRASWTAVLLVGLTALYLASHLDSYRVGLVEKIGMRWTHQAPLHPVLWWLAVAGTALIPIVYLAVGIRTRRAPFLLAGLGTGIASVITFVNYAGLEPAWAVLIVAGALLVAAIFTLRRYLESGPAGERHGFTAAPLFEDLAQQRWLEAGAAAVTLAPEARTLREEPTFSGGGGDFGGGGSSSEF
jgi:hypothetical protein